MARKSILPLLFVFLPTAAFCQDYGSCETALEVCSKGLLEFNYRRDSIRAAPDEKADCLGGIYETTWLIWEIVEDGYLSFTIMPEMITDDIDFAVYKLDREKGCEQKKLIRCALSGENVGAPLKDNLPCLGFTGLTTAEPHKTQEDLGCGWGKNNFLAALDCKKGERYALAFQDFSNAKGRLLIEFCGSAQLPCDSIFCEELTRKKSRLPGKQMVVFSNQVSGKIFFVFLYGFNEKEALVTIQDVAGKTVLEEKISLEKEQDEYEIQVGDLPPGSYRALILVGKQAVAGKFVKVE